MAANHTFTASESAMAATLKDDSAVVVEAPLPFVNLLYVSLPVAFTAPLGAFLI
jgi:hypothetical protein